MNKSLLITVIALLMMTIQAQDWNHQGVPNQLVDDVPVSSSLLHDIGVALPEGRPVPQYHAEYLNESNQKNIILTEEAEVFITFVHEGAGFRNSFGYFTYTADTIPQSPSDVTHIPIFANASYLGSGGGLRTGNTVSLGTHPAGTHIGFWVKSNAWNNNTKTIGNGIWSLYSLNHLNPEQSATDRQHIASLWHSEEEKLVLGFEDIQREVSWCDQDFNDCIFFATASPSTAIDISEVQELETFFDEDGDGVQDSADLFPFDAERASINYYPSKNGKSLLCFEDNFPSKGDYDFNDMIVAASTKEIVDANDKLKEFNLKMELKAMGASYHNGFAIQLPIPNSEIESATLKINDILVSDRNIIESGSVNETVFLIMLDAFDHIDAADNFPNTINGQSRVQADHFELNVVLKNTNSIVTWPYNPFIYVNQVRGREVHLLNKQPTEKVDLSYFNTQDDKSIVDENKYYRDSNNMPWAMINDSSWEWPLEFIEITQSYPQFATWAQSSGALEANWYATKVENKIWRGENAAMRSDNFDDGRVASFWKTANLASLEPKIEEKYGRLYITAAGKDVWAGVNQYAARYTTVVGDFDASVKILSQQNTHGWAKAGFMLKDDMLQAGTNRYIAVKTPAHGFLAQFDSNSNGLLDGTQWGGGTDGYVRLARSGNTLTSYRKEKLNDSWTIIGSVTLNDLKRKIRPWTLRHLYTRRSPIRSSVR